MIGRVRVSSLPLCRSHPSTPPSSSFHELPEQTLTFHQHRQSNRDHSRQQHIHRHQSITMGVSKTTLTEGSGSQPVAGDTVTIEYTGWLKDTSKPNNKGAKFDSSVGRGDFVVKIGVGQVIKGWDDGVTQMKVGEKATLDISSDFGYGARDVELKASKK
ncbi:FK506-binding protein 1B [Tolypocladium ophioglossoides CBS 100239]|uniref:peptidylprolyl isomerase n=1 Tax=Tolypocladium ophioglossoides (strain CBS 100239) TaxID=1163406 RepID=A0A0L0NBI1_TOLOC|nr:FK506-binding protein 1B [Tolypocladium ophioglossoides CBS 100239]